jgi:hypothetical protein
MERFASDTTLTEEQRALIRQWLADYEQWREARAAMDPVASQRQRDASTSLALMLVGLPLYIVHWRMIQRRAR